MDIWEMLYGDFLKKESLSDGRGDDDYLTVEAKIEELRRRVGLLKSNDCGANGIDKSAGLIILAQEDPMIDIISAAMALASRPMADKTAVLKELESVFPEHRDIIRQNRDYLYERMGGRPDDHRGGLVIEPLQTVDEREDSKIFESISDKIQR